MFRGNMMVAVVGVCAAAVLGCDSGSKKSTGSTTTKTGGGDTTAAAPAGKMGTSTITGKVSFSGKAPKRKKLNREADPVCAGTKMKSEDVLVGDDGSLANVLVRVSGGLSGTYSGGSSDPVIIDQSDCMYRPRVAAAVDGQKLEIRNSDKTLHNVHVWLGKKTVFNRGMPPGAKPVTPKPFSDSGKVYRFSCDVHPWMEGHLAVVPNPFFAVSGTDGTFNIAKLPAGTYTVEAWHEEYGTKTGEVTVKDGESGSIDFQFSATETAAAPAQSETRMN